MDGNEKSPSDLTSGLRLDEIVKQSVNKSTSMLSSIKVLYTISGVHNRRRSIQCMIMLILINMGNIATLSMCYLIIRVTATCHFLMELCLTQSTVLVSGFFSYTIYRCSHVLRHLSYDVNCIYGVIYSFLR